MGVEVLKFQILLSHFRPQQSKSNMCDNYLSAAKKTCPKRTQKYTQDPKPEERMKITKERTERTFKTKLIECDETPTRTVIWASPTCCGFPTHFLSSPICKRKYQQTAGRCAECKQSNRNCRACKDIEDRAVPLNTMPKEKTKAFRLRAFSTIFSNFCVTNSNLRSGCQRCSRM